MDTETEEQLLNYAYWASYPNLLERYDLVKEIGKGGQATVFLCRSKRGSKKRFACKTISTTQVEYTDPEEEILIMKKLDRCPGIVHLHEGIKDDGFWHLIMELCECSLLDLIAEKGRLCEEEAALLIRNLALAIQSLHQNGIIHRDLKPDNILVASAEEPYDVRVSDFGSSACFEYFAPNFTSIVGTPDYMAPEVWHGFYSTEIDIWGLGLILYQSLTGMYHLSDSDSETDSEADSEIMCQQLLHGDDLAASQLEWPPGMVSEQARSLVLSMLRPDPDQRISLQQILSHPWVVKYSVPCERKIKMKILPDENEKAADQSLNQKRPCHENTTCMLPSKLVKIQGTNNGAVKPSAIA